MVAGRLAWAVEDPAGVTRYKRRLRFVRRRGGERHKEMKTAFIVLMSIIVCSCSGSSDRHLGSLLDSATDHLRRGDFSGALALADQGIALTSNAPATERAGQFRLLKAELLILQGKSALAVPFIDDTKPAVERSPRLRSKEKYLQGRMDLALGHLPDAIDRFDEARRRADEASAVDLQIDAKVFLGQAYLRSNRRDEADSVLHEALEQAQHLDDHYRQAAALLNLGMRHLNTSYFEEALFYFNRALAFEDLRSTANYATALRNAGVCYMRLGKFDEALNVQQHAVALIEKSEFKSSLGGTLGDLGTTYLLVGDGHRSIEYLKRAVEVAAEVKATRDQALYTGNLAAAYAAVKAWDEADHFNQEAIRLTADIGSSGERSATLQVDNTLTTGFIAEGRGQYKQASASFKRAMDEGGGNPRTIWRAETGLARVALASKQPVEATSHFEAALRSIEKTQTVLLNTDDQISFLTRLVQFYQEYVDVLVAQGHVDEALEVADSSRARILAERNGRVARATTVSAERSSRNEVEASISSKAVAGSRIPAAEYMTIAKRTGTVLVSYWVAPTHSYVWVVTPREIRCLPLASADEIAAAVGRYRQLIEETIGDPLKMTGSAGNPTSAGEQLYAELISPIAKWIPRGSSVVVVPDGVLHNLNFETLPVTAGTDRHYWLDDVTVSVAPSLGVLTASSPSSAAGHSLLLMGDPVASDKQFPALRFASGEMAGVEKAIGHEQTVVYHGAQASPRAYREARPERFAMIHFTAHAEANHDSPLDSAVVLSTDGARYKLYARDVVAQPLNADLVTISACRSAGARTYSGEGLVGFAWAFLRAGARNVVAGLWDVDDQSTAQLVPAFYDRLAAGDRPAVALRQAKLALAHSPGNFAKPYYWAPFQVFTLSP
jgi:CHAT domain-containing protein